MKKYDIDDTAGFGLINTKGEELKLSMQELWVSGSVLPAGADLVWRHTFQCDCDSPIEAVYAFALPRDASLHSFRIVGDGFNVESELQPVEKARETYEEGIANGSLSSLAQEHRDGIVNLSVGNIRPHELVTVYLRMLVGVETNDSGFRLRLPFTLAPGYHPAARCVETEAGRGEIELPAREFGDVLLPPFEKDAGTLHRVGFDLDVRMPYCDIEGFSSPSHPVSVDMRDGDSTRISLGSRDDLPNRDLVLDVKGNDREPRMLTGVSAEGRGEFIAVLPSQIFGEQQKEARRVVFLLDRSGSMRGRAIDEAKQAVGECLRALGPEDRFNIVAFDTEVESASPDMLSGGEEGIARAQEFLEGIDSRGGTEIMRGIDAAAKLAGEHGAAVFLITDGQVFGTEDILSLARRSGIVIHTLGIGSAARDRFITQLSRGTGGVSRSLNPNERIVDAALEVFAGIAAPIASDLSVGIEGMETAVLEASTLAGIFPGSPLIVYGETVKPGDGSLLVEWAAPENGKLSLDLDLSGQDSALGETLRLLRGAKMLNDRESLLSGEEGSGKVLEELSREYGLSSRAMSLVAVVERDDDEAGTPPKTSVVATGMPQDMEFNAYFNVPQAGLGRSDMVSESVVCSCEPSKTYYRDYDKSISLLQSVHMPGVERLLEKIVAEIAADGGVEGVQVLERVVKSLLALRLLQSCPLKSYKKYEQRLLHFLLQAGYHKIPNMGDHLDAGLAALDKPVFQGLNLEADRGQWRSAALIYLHGRYEFRDVVGVFDQG